MALKDVGLEGSQQEDRYPTNPHGYYSEGLWRLKSEGFCYPSIGAVGWTSWVKGDGYYGYKMPAIITHEPLIVPGTHYTVEAQTLVGSKGSHPEDLVVTSAFRLDEGDLQERFPENRRN